MKSDYYILRGWLLLALSLTFLNSAGSLAAENAKLEIPSADKFKVAGRPPVLGLKWKAEEVEIREGYSQGGANHYVVLEGQYERPFYKIFYQLEWQKTPTEIQPGKPFAFEVPYTGPTTLFQIIVVNASGVSEGQTFHIVFPDETQKEEAVKGPPKRNIAFFPSLGLTYSSLRQSNGRSLAQTLLTFKGTYSYVFAPPRWDLGVGMFFSLVPITSNIPNTWARFLGLNLRLGYSIPLSPRWTLGLVTGTYYTTMFVSKTAKVGFENLMGPQIYPTLRYQLNKNVTFASYFKISAVGSQFQLHGIDDRELATGFSYIRNTANGRPMIMSLDFSSLQATISNVTISSKSASLGIGVGF